MKKLFTLFAVIIVFASQSLFAQLELTPYLPTEHIETARTEAAKVITDPVFLSAVTVNGTLPGLEIGGTPIPIDFFIEGDDKGKSSGWVFLFNSEAEPENIQAIAVAISILGTTPFNLSQMGLPLDFLDDYISDNNLESVNWMNSDAMVDILVASTPYTDFMSTYPDAMPKYITLGFADFPLLDASTPYWLISVNDVSDSTLILINALDGTVMDVEEEIVITESLEIYPNPTTDVISIKNDMPFIGNSTIEILDILGNIVEVYSDVQMSNGYQLNCSAYSNGTYYLKIRNSNKSYIKKFIISK